MNQNQSRASKALASGAGEGASQLHDLIDQLAHVMAAQCEANASRMHEGEYKLVDLKGGSKRSKSKSFNRSASAAQEQLGGEPFGAGQY
jgi:hypothetical protein